MKRFIVTDEHGGFRLLEAEDAKYAIERHICQEAMAIDCDVQDLASFEIEAHEIASTTKAYWRTWKISNGKLELKGTT